MKLLFVCLCAMFELAFANVVNLEFKRTAETGSMNRFETTNLASNDEAHEKRFVVPNGCGDTCKSGYVKSRYCTHPAKFCFGSGQVVHVPFNPPFQRAPKVMIGLTLVDTHKDQNVRVRASVENVTSTGFKIRFSPWDVSITYQLGVNWMACP